MIRVLFICHGNICRSPMAEFIFKDLVRKAGPEGEFEIASAATSTEEIGNDIYPPARRMLDAHGIPHSRRGARQITKADYKRYDLLIGMDSANLRNMRYAFGGDPLGKIRLMSEFGHFDGEVADPWYTGDFALTFDQLLDGCRGLLKFARLLPILQEQIEAPPGLIRPDASLKDDLSLDSFTIVFLISKVEDVFDTEFSEDEVFYLQTLRDIMDKVQI